MEVNVAWPAVDSGRNFWKISPCANDVPICASTKGRRASNVPSVRVRNIEPLSSRLKLLKNWSKYDILMPAINTPWK
ncbi:hypothetical protein D3C85_1592700 [compost metagenome]